MSNYERITDEEIYDGFPRERHEYRYEIASRYVKKTDVVVDAACGTGYGKKFLNCKEYIGVDKFVEDDLTHSSVDTVLADLNEWDPDFDFDVFISIETLEHLEGYEHLIEVAKRAKRLMIISSPVIPTKHINEFHVNDFTFDELKSMLEDNEWKVIYSEIQDNEYGIFILQKHE